MTNKTVVPGLVSLCKSRMGSESLLSLLVRSIRHRCSILPRVRNVISKWGTSIYREKERIRFTSILLFSIRSLDFSQHHPFMILSFHISMWQKFAGIFVSWELSSWSRRVLRSCSARDGREQCGIVSVWLTLFSFFICCYVLHYYSSFTNSRIVR